jgi:hypothetical protein
MSDLKVNNKVFNIPDPGASPNWAKDVTNWIKEVTTVLSSLAGLGTITETQSIIENGINVLTPKLVPGLIFNSNLTKSATVAYRIYRKTQNTTAVTETGVLTIQYSDIDPLNKWSIQREITNGEPTFVYFDIDNLGQVKYHSTLINNNTPTIDSNYEGYIRFKTTNIIK